MILKKFFGKTLEAVKKSAKQMYGDDFIILDSNQPGGDQEAAITVMAGKDDGTGSRSGRKTLASKGSGRAKFETGSQSGSTTGTTFEASRQTGPQTGSGLETATQSGSTRFEPSSSLPGKNGTSSKSGNHFSITGTTPEPSGNRSGNRGTAFKPGRTQHLKRDKLGRFVKKKPREDEPNKRDEKQSVTGSNTSPYLKALRKYAEEQDAERSAPRGSKTSSEPPEEVHSDNSMKGTQSENISDLPSGKSADEEPDIARLASNTYSRASIRKPSFQNGNGPVSNTESEENENPSPEFGKKRSADPEGIRSPEAEQDQPESKRHPGRDSHLNNTVDPAPSRNLRLNGPQTDPAVTAMRREQQEVAALHKRFDKLEALLGSSLITSSFDYVSHPVFQQLVQTGISTSVIARWFSTILKQGVDPYDQPETFMVKLSGIIREAINTPPAGDPQKYLLFTGSSGAGKTHLIMKLALHEDFMAGKKVGVISLLPQGKENELYYTVMEPFCKEQDIPWFAVRSGKEVTSLLEEWETYDHLFIDTPSISTEQDHSFRQFWKLRQLVNPLAPLEIHYVVNAALNRYYFQQSLATHHPLLPDYIAITHLDEISQWGPIIPFLEEMGCATRYVSTGESIPYSLKEFNPAWFAQQVLEDQQ